MIPYPFPADWHKITDDGEHLDIDTVEDWATLVTAFTAEWLDLEGFMGDPKQARSDETPERRTQSRGTVGKDEL